MILLQQLLLLLLLLLLLSVFVELPTFWSYSRLGQVPNTEAAGFWQTGALPVAQPTVSKHWRKGLMMIINCWSDACHLSVVMLYVKIHALCRSSTQSIQCSVIPWSSLCHSITQFTFEYLLCSSVISGHTQPESCRKNAVRQTSKESFQLEPWREARGVDNHAQPGRRQSCVTCNMCTPDEKICWMRLSTERNGGAGLSYVLYTRWTTVSVRFLEEKEPER